MSEESKVMSTNDLFGPTNTPKNQRHLNLQSSRFSCLVMSIAKNIAAAQRGSLDRADLSRALMLEILLLVVFGCRVTTLCETRE